MQIYVISCKACHKTVETMNEAHALDAAFSCTPCQVIQARGDKALKTIDGAPAGYVHGGVSNKAGHSSGKVFKGN